MAAEQGGRLVTVFGGSGFVGRHVVRALVRRGWRVRAAVRRPDLAGHLQPMGVVGQVHAVQANLRYPDSVAAAVANADAVVNLVGILAKQGRQTFDAVHAEGAATIARASKAAGIGAVVGVSAIGADKESSSRYARTKAAGEAALLAEVPGTVILRPSIVFGPEDEFFNRFGAMARISPVLPLIGGGRTRFQPVYVGDVAEAVAVSLEGKARPGTIYELGGPEVLTFRELLDRTQAWTGHRRPYFPIPFWLAKLMAIGSAPLPNGLRPFTLDQVRLLQRDNIVSEAAFKQGRTLHGLGITQPRATLAIVPEYLERFRPKGQFSHYRG